MLWMLQVISTCLMAGIVWVVQLCHYPMFRYIEPSQFAEGHRFHTASITWIAAPLMLVELGSAVALAFLVNPKPNFATILLALTVGIWIATFFVSVPLHNRLQEGFNKEIIERLVSTHWVRTALYTFKVFFVARALRG